MVSEKIKTYEMTSRETYFSLIKTASSGLIQKSEKKIIKLNKLSLLFKNTFGKEDFFQKYF